MAGVLLRESAVEVFSEVDDEEEEDDAEEDFFSEGGFSLTPEEGGTDWSVSLFDSVAAWRFVAELSEGDFPSELLFFVFSDGETSFFEDFDFCPITTAGYCLRSRNIDIVP